MTQTPAKATDSLAELYRTMRRIRTFEERVSELFVRGGTAGSMLHLSIGEEAIAGVCALMQDADTFTSHHRGHGIFLARGADPRRMMAEIAGKASGYCGGKGGSMHIADAALGSLGANAIVGGGIPHSVGAAYAYRLRGEPRVSVPFYGDGAMQQGLLYECMNMAALWKLPVLFVCINNQYGMGTHIKRAAACLDFVDRARTFGLDAAEADGAAVLDVVAKARSLVDGARKEGRPALLIINCYRFYGHARMDKSPYRDDAEEVEGRKLDPVANARKDLVAATSGEQTDQLDDEIAAEMDEAVEHAFADEYPPVASLFDGVYGNGAPKPEPVRDRIDRALSEE